MIRPSLTPVRDELPQAGRCTDDGLAVVDCAAPHEAEVVGVGGLDGMSGGLPTDVDLRKAALPGCRTAVTSYLGSPDHDATRLQARVFWPSRDGWARGDRWVLCTVVEVRPDGVVVKRSGSAKDLLKAAGFPTVQLCAEGSPAKDDSLKPTTCDRTHLAEAVPGVVGLGVVTDPVPSKDEVDTIVKSRCATAVRGYLNADRPDVIASWRTFGEQGWAEGFTTAVCYAEASRPFTGTLWGIGTKPLP
ncbi:septum formation family protein [Actinosynnema sp. NPDC020468]|uniref:septum formation family protein n=1 Tax=Actinosynnema sp. NPDC020468 TaxID=3154488 RepID=UPI0033C50300